MRKKQQDANKPNHKKQVFGAPIFMKRRKFRDDYFGMISFETFNCKENEIVPRYGSFSTA